MPAALLSSPASLPAGMVALVTELATLWAEAPERLRPSAGVVKYWDKLIAAWAAEPSLPLYVRKAKDNRGSVVLHASGRHLVPTDNSPAQWAFALAALGQTPTLESISRTIHADGIPVAMALKAT